MNIIPLWQKVLVNVDKASKTVGDSFIEKPIATVEREQMTEIKGTILAIGAGSFNGWDGRKPIVGDRVIFAKFAGHYIAENDTVIRLMNDDDIVAITE